MRKSVAIMSVGATLLTALALHEDFRAGPYVPTEGDRPTIGYGSTFYPDGTPVRMTDAPVTKKQAWDMLAADVDKTYSACVKKSLGTTKLEQVEFDLAVDFARQYGCVAFDTSGMKRNLVAGNYVKACESYLEYRYMTSTRKESAGWEPYRFDASGKPTRWRYDCSTVGNKICRGVWTRQLGRYKDCMSVQG